MHKVPDSKRDERIVLIDDSPETILYIVSVLNEFNVKSFQSPVNSYSSLEGADVVILDYDLPEVSGLEYISFLNDNYPDLPVIMITGQGSEEVCQHAFRLGIRDYITKPFVSKELREIVYKILAERKRTKKTLKKEKKKISPVIYNKIYQAKHFIDKNIYKNLKLDDVLNYVGMSKTPFSKYFKEEFGMTYRAYLLQKKIEKAKELLKDGQSVSGIADALGFSDVSYFSKIFKKHTKTLPSQYQNNG